MGESRKNNKRPGSERRPRLDPGLLALMRLVERRQFHDVELAARRILDSRPNQPLATKALTFALVGQGRYADALPILNHALAVRFDDPELYNNRGIALSELMRWDESIADFNASLRIAPDDPEVLKNLGVAFSRMHRWNDAVPPLLKAIECHPGDYIDAIEVLAGALSNGGRIDEAWLCYNELWSGEKDVRFLYELISTSMRRCDWVDVGKKIEDLRNLSGSFNTPVGNPFISLFCPKIDRREQLLIASSHVIEFIPKQFLESKFVFSEPSALNGRRLKVAYLSADFRTHPVGFIIPQVIELHDRSRIEVFGYSIGVDDGSDIRRRLLSAFDTFVDMQHASVTQLVQRIRDDKIDILVDLQGWTSSGRPEVLALRAAPIQVNWLGYAGTMGSGHLADYLIGDQVVTPLEHAENYAECLALLPGAYLPADNSLVIPAEPLREREGLPQEKFIYCSFNNSYKFNPEVFDAWCRLLRRAENSCLWLSSPAGDGAGRLKMEACKRDVDPDRIVFASRVESRIEHLARLKLADVALDPFPYNSHSTGIDVLWAGVPMVSLLGNTFPGRVGASLLKNVGLGDLIADCVAEYEEIALSLYQDQAKLKELRTRLASGRIEASLFDSVKFASSLEKIYFSMWRNYVAGKKETIRIQ